MKALLILFLTLSCIERLLLVPAATTNSSAGRTKNDDNSNVIIGSPKNHIPPHHLNWQQCSVFIAPSASSSETNNNNNVTNLNWGVYANRDFVKGEIVDVSPLTVPIPDRSDTIELSILNDYVYGYWRVQPQQTQTQTQQPMIEKLYSVLFGPDMVYNHHPVAPNVEFTTFGREPASDIPYAINPQGFVAKRKISRGEELFTSYNGKEDGGSQWFHRRGLVMTVPQPSTPSSSSSFDLFSKQYCSKIYSGLGLPSWNRLLPILPKHYDLPFHADLKWFAPDFDGGLWEAKTKMNVRIGDRLEVSTALVLSVERTKRSALMPLVFAWNDLHDDHRAVVINLHKKKELRLQYQGPDTDWKPINNLTTTTTGRDDSNIYDDIGLFAVAGNIGMVQRLSTHASGDANCRLIIHDNDSSIHSLLKHPMGVTIELVATEDMVSGTNLIVDVIESSVATYLEYKLLYRELKRTGQPYNTQVFRHQQELQNQKTVDREKTISSSSSLPSKVSTRTPSTPSLPVAIEEL